MFSYTTPFCHHSLLLDLVSISSAGNHSETIGTNLVVIYSRKLAEWEPCFSYCLDFSCLFRNCCLLGSSHSSPSLYCHSASVEKTLEISEELCPCDLNASGCQCSLLPVVSSGHVVKQQCASCSVERSARWTPIFLPVLALLSGAALLCLALFSHWPGYSTSPRYPDCSDPLKGSCWQQIFSVSLRKTVNTYLAESNI